MLTPVDLGMALQPEQPAVPLVVEHAALDEVVVHAEGEIDWRVRRVARGAWWHACRPCEALASDGADAGRSGVPEMARI